MTIFIESNSLPLKQSSSARLFTKFWTLHSGNFHFRFLFPHFSFLFLGQPASSTPKFVMQTSSNLSHARDRNKGCQFPAICWFVKTKLALARHFVQANIYLQHISHVLILQHTSSISHVPQHILSYATRMFSLQHILSSVSHVPQHVFSPAYYTSHMSSPCPTP